MEHSILNDIKKLIGPSVSYTVFDPDIIININAAFFTLFQLGVGSRHQVFTIDGEDAVWKDFSDDESIIAAVKQYVYLKVRLVFDPPTASNVYQAYSEKIQELEWRLREMAAGMFEEERESEIEDGKVPKSIIVGILDRVFGDECEIDPTKVSKSEIDKMLDRIFEEEDDEDEQL